MNERLDARRAPADWITIPLLAIIGACGRTWTGAAWPYRCSGRDRFEGTGCTAPRLEASNLVRARQLALAERTNLRLLIIEGLEYLVAKRGAK